MFAPRTAIAAWIAASLAALTWASACTGASPRTYSVRLDVPPRLQWEANDGYCGEVSFIAAGLSYGQYLSQYDARAIASPGTPESRASSQLLLGVNDVSAARRMRLDDAVYTPTAHATTAAFLAWVKTELIEGHPVAIGVYMNESRFDGSRKRSAGDPEYDHIVLVTGISSRSPLTLPATYRATDALTFSDHGLWDGVRHALFTVEFGAFAATRRQANAPRGPVYSLAAARRDYGIAFTGVADADHETLPVRVSTSSDRELPAIRDGSDRRPRASRLGLTVTVSGLTPGRRYTLYRYDAMARVPTSAFNARRGAAAQRWTFTATAATHTLHQAVLSRDEVIYRAVPASAP